MIAAPSGRARRRAAPALRLGSVLRPAAPARGPRSRSSLCRPLGGREKLLPAREDPGPGTADRIPRRRLAGVARQITGSSTPFRVLALSWPLTDRIPARDERVEDLFEGVAGLKPGVVVGRGHL